MVCPTEKAVYNLAFLRGLRVMRFWSPCVDPLAPLYPIAQMVVRTSLSIWPQNGRLEDDQMKKGNCRREGRRHRETTCLSLSPLTWQIHLHRWERLQGRSLISRSGSKYRLQLRVDLSCHGALSFTDSQSICVRDILLKMAKAQPWL